ncbi:MAG: outer membrane lipoprotein-sorting protein [Myxococcaceae bacterium]
MTTLILTLLVLGAEPPTVKDVLTKYDSVMAPPSFKATATMTAHRDDGSTRSYKMAILKGADDKSRIWFQEPAAVRGQEMLRNGENFWVYMPNLKKALRLASRDNFQGGDFNNADVLRANYANDYDGTVKEDPARPDTWLVELKSKNPDTSYDAVKLWISKANPGVPVRGEYFTSSGKLMRSADFSDVKDFGNGLKRPAHITMRNEIATQRYSEMTWEAVDITAGVSDAKFGLNDLGH